MAPGFCEVVKSKIAPARLLQAGVIDLHNSLPLIAPSMVSSGAIIEGDGGVGTIRQFNFSELNVYPNGFKKEVIDILDKEKLEYQTTQIDGGDIGKKLASASYHFKLVPADDGGSVVTITADYTENPGSKFTEEDIKVDKAEIMVMFEAMEGYLLANPAAYA